MSDNPVLSNDEQLKLLAELKARHSDLERRRARIEATVAESARREKDEAAAAKEKFGTDDLAEIRNKIVNARKENSDKLYAFQAQLNALEADIVAAEKVIQG